MCLPLFIVAVLFSCPAFADSPLDVAFKNAGLAKGNSESENISRILKYLDTDYRQFGKPQNTELRKLMEANNGKDIQRLLGKNIPAEIKNDQLQDLLANLDMYRSAEQAVTQAGQITAPGCRVRSLVFGEMLKRTGFKATEIFILETVNENDLRAICSQEGRPASANYRQGLSGHTFVLLNLPGKGWRLIDTNYSLQSAQNQYGNGIPFFSPKEIEDASSPRKMIPLDGNPYFSNLGNLYAFSVRPIDRTLNFKFSQRQNVVASGSPTDPTCKRVLRPKAETSNTDDQSAPPAGQ